MFAFYELVKKKHCSYLVGGEETLQVDITKNVKCAGEQELRTEIKETTFFQSFTTDVKYNSSIFQKYCQSYGMSLNDIGSFETIFMTL